MVLVQFLGTFHQAKSAPTERRETIRLDEDVRDRFSSEHLFLGWAVARDRFIPFSNKNGLCESNLTHSEYSQPFRHIQYNPTPSLRDMAPLAATLKGAYVSRRYCVLFGTDQVATKLLQTGV
jgi:hypothetical protein